MQNRARVSGLKSDLAAAATQLGQVNATDGNYPPNANSLKKSDTTEFEYTYTETDNTYCITATHATADVGAFHRINGGPIEEGACSGHSGAGSGGGTETYAVGDTGPAGGTIFHIDENVYYEVAPSDAGGGATAPWGCGGTLIGTSLDFGSGKANTAAILSACSASGIAARLADEYSIGGYSDWFLPSSHEMYAILDNLHTPGLQEFPGHMYWHSSEMPGAFGASYAGAKIISSEDQQFMQKTSTSNRVRAVRSFTQ